MAADPASSFKSWGELLDGYQEQHSRASEAARAVRSMNNAKDRELRFAQRFDVVTLQPWLPASSDGSLAQRRRIPDTRTAHDILTHSDNKTKPWMGHVPEGYFEERGPAGKRTLAHRTAREFDVITNKYHVAHDARVAVDEHRTRADVSRKYWQTHSYDPLLAKFIDPARESSVQQHEEEHRRTWGQDADKKLPPCIRRSEGVAYNPVTMVVRSQDRLEEFKRTHERTPISPLRYAAEQHARSSAEAVAAAQARRGVNRVAAARFKGAQHGYDIVSNEPTSGRGARQTFPALPQDRPAPWERLHVPA